MPDFFDISNESNPQSTISKYIQKYQKYTKRNVIVYFFIMDIFITLSFFKFFNVFNVTKYFGGTCFSRKH